MWDTLLIHIDGTHALTLAYAVVKHVGYLLIHIDSIGPIISLLISLSTVTTKYKQTILYAYNIISHILLPFNLHLPEYFFLISVILCLFYSKYALP